MGLLYTESSDLDNSIGIGTHQTNVTTVDLTTILDVHSVENILKSTKTNYFKGYEYRFGLESLKTGLKNFDAKGVYVSKPLKISNPLQIGLKAEEQRPFFSAGTIGYTTTTYDTSDDRLFYGSIEYWILQEDYDIKHNLIKFKKYPILPLNKSRIHHERLILTERNSPLRSDLNKGYLNFLANSTDQDVVVYKNGIELSNWTLSGNYKPNNGAPMKTSISISSTTFLSDIYTVSYTPRVSSSTDIESSVAYYYKRIGLGVAMQSPIIDLVGDLSVVQTKNQSLLLSPPSDSSISYLRLMIILRNNNTNFNTTPAVEEYYLLTNNKKIGNI